MTNMFCPWCDIFYIAKSYTQLYTDIYNCHTQRNYNAFIQKQTMWIWKKWYGVLQVRILNGNSICQRILLGQWWRNISQRKKTASHFFLIPSGNCKQEIDSIIRKNQSYLLYLLRWLSPRRENGTYFVQHQSSRPGRSVRLYTSWPQVSN